MSSIVALVLPFFGLIFLGYGVAKILRLPEEGLAWMNVFIVYLALPALFFVLIARTPVEELSNWRFILVTTCSTALVFGAAFVIGALRDGNVAEATMQGIAASYSNVGYMGPGLTLAVLGTAATAPTALIFSFDSTLLFILLPLCMAFGGAERGGAGAMALGVAKRVFLHPFILATIAGVLAAITGFEPPQAAGKILDYLMNAAAPCALFAMGVTVALRPLTRVPGELPHLLTLKLIIHPLLVWFLLSLVGGFEPVWVQTAVLMAALPPALNVFIMARHYSVYVERSSSVVLLGTLASIVTLTSFIYAVSSGLLPLDPFG